MKILKLFNTNHTCVNVMKLNVDLTAHYNAILIYYAIFQL